MRHLALRSVTLPLALLTIVTGSGCTFVFAAGGAASDRNAAADHQRPLADALPVRDGARVTLVTRDGRKHAGYWRGIAVAEGDTVRKVLLQETQGLRRVPVARIAGVQTLRRSGVKAGALAGLAADVLLAGLMLRGLSYGPDNGD